jgi:hypothetical protein
MIKMTTNFVFSSVGDNTSFDTLWIGEDMNYDIYVIYYGDNEEIYNSYKNKVKFIEKRKGSKFQNFKYFYDKYFDIVDKYERFFILDDDIIFNVMDINKMFEISINYDLDICGPSFSDKGEISHQITKHVDNVLLTYTNFVEVNTPLFNKTALYKLMNILPYELIGWGIDLLSIWANGNNKEKSYAIVHSVICINPRIQDKKFNTSRELKKVDNCDRREQIWYEFVRKMKIQCPEIKNYNSIPL